MKRSGSLFVASALAALVISFQPASAHEVNIEIVGGQYLYYSPELPPDGGPMRYIGTPAGPIDLGATPSSEGIDQIDNRDALDHTFTECTAGCGTATASSVGARFDLRIPARSSVTGVGLPAGPLTFMCTIHPWMRGAINA